MIGNFWAILKKANLSKKCCEYYLANVWKYLGNFFIPTPSHTAIIATGAAPKVTIDRHGKSCLLKINLIYENCTSRFSEMQKSPADKVQY